MNLKHISNMSVLLTLIVLLPSCKKYLDVKSDQSLSTPETLEDLQLMLDHEDFQRKGVSSTQTASDEYYVLFSNWQTRTDELKLGYIWDPQLDSYNDWRNQYALVLITNTVLENVSKIMAKAPGQTANEIKGTALFLRSHCYYQLAQVYCVQYDSTTARSNHGLVLRVDPNFNTPSKRSTIQETYEQIIKDLKEAVNLLPTSTVANTRPNKAAGYALLARVYLQIGDYQNAKLAAEQSLSLNNHLLDYNNSNDIAAGSSSPIKSPGIKNKEILFFVQEDRSLNRNPSMARIDSVLYNSYAANDVRKTAFFIKISGQNAYRFKGSYIGSSSTMFVGIGTAEVYLIKAESNARLGNINAAMQDLNSLLEKRYAGGIAPSYTPGTIQEAVSIILDERKKETVYRGMRWADIKRLNKNPQTAITLQRELNGTIYTLPPNDPRYALLIPRNIMEMTDLEQNQR